LGIAYLNHFDYNGDLHHLSLGLDQFKLAVNFIPPDSLDVSHCLHNIATCYSKRYGRLSDLGDLDLAIYSMQSLQKMNHLDAPSHKKTLASLFHSKFVLENDMNFVDRWKIEVWLSRDIPYSNGSQSN
jgi:hypothetical protein